MNERGHYGNRTFVGAEDPRSADRITTKALSNIHVILAAAVVLGAGYLVVTRPTAKTMGRQIDARKLTEGELASVRAGRR